MKAARSGCMWAGLAALVALAGLQPAWAEAVPRTESGETLLRASTYELIDGPVRTGDIFATIVGRPTLVVRIDTSVNTRTRPGPTHGPAAGSFLFGYRLATGVAYCDPLLAEGLQQRRQCFRDFNNDGVFDGGYVTSRGGTSRYFPDQVESLVPIAPLPFVAAESGDLPEVTLRLRLVHVSEERAEVAVVTPTDEWRVSSDADETEAGVFRFPFGVFRIARGEGGGFVIERVRRAADVGAPAAEETS